MAQDACVHVLFPGAGVRLEEGRLLSGDLYRFLGTVSLGRAPAVGVGADPSPVSLGPMALSIAPLLDLLDRDRRHASAVQPQHALVTRAAMGRGGR